jgi:hypothetical protein
MRTIGILGMLVFAVAVAQGALAQKGALASDPNAEDIKLDPAKWRVSVETGEFYPSMLIANAVRKSREKNPPRILGSLNGVINVAVYSEKPDTVVDVQVEVDELAEPTKLRYTIPTEGQYFIRPTVRWKYSKLAEMNQPFPTTMKVSVWMDGKPLPPPVQRPMRVHSVNDVPYLYRNPRGAWYDMTWMLVAFVNEESPVIDGLLQEALQTGIVKRFGGYQVDRSEVQRQVAAIYTALQKRGIVYSSTSQNSTSEQDLTLSQHVRFVSESVKYTQANCIDGVVLMASILRRIELDPLIIVGPGHAMLGFHVAPGRTRDITVVETTMLATSNFDESLKAGDATFRKWQQGKDPRFRVIEVAEWRDRGVMPIPR